MTDNIVLFPGADAPEKDENEITPEKVLKAAHDRYDELILIGRTKGTNKYECVSTTDIPETLFHVTRIQHRLNVFLDKDCK
jgi:cystathionine beta-lyase family protein involved in aluminum resistance